MGKRFSDFNLPIALFNLNCFQFKGKINENTIWIQTKNVNNSIFFLNWNLQKIQKEEKNTIWKKHWSLNENYKAFL